MTAVVAGDDARFVRRGLSVSIECLRVDTRAVDTLAVLVDDSNQGDSRFGRDLLRRVPSRSAVLDGIVLRCDW